MFSVCVQTHYDSIKLTTDVFTHRSHAQDQSIAQESLQLSNCGCRSAQLLEMDWMGQLVHFYSFLVEYLQCNCVEGAKYLFDSLVNAASAINDVAVCRSHKYLFMQFRFDLFCTSVRHY